MKNQITILGNKINCFNDYRELYDFILSDIRKEKASNYITVNNVHTIVEGYRKASFQKIINESYLSIPDGKPLQIFGKLKGNKIISRLFGPTVMEKFIDWGRTDNIRHFFLGSSEENLHKLQAAIELKYPGTNIVGLISPPYKPFENWDNDNFILAINEARPDFIWIGLGAPKQELWMYNQHRAIGHGVLFGIGAGFDYLAGNTKHAPNWMKNLSLEWVYRPRARAQETLEALLIYYSPIYIICFSQLLGIKLKK